MKHLAIITTHPIQYNAPIFKCLAQREKIKVRVFYTWGIDVLKNKYDPGFGIVINWDIPLLDGYDYIFEKNISKSPGSHHFKGIDNPELLDNIIAFQADAILLFGWKFKSHLKCMKYFHNKIPILFRGDSTLLGERSLIKYLLRKIILRWVYKYVDIALYVGQHNKNYFKYFGLKQAQMLFAPHCIDNQRFSCDNESRESLALKEREFMGISDTDIVFLYAGKFEKIKQLDLLINAFSKIKDDNIHLILVGDGPIFKFLELASANDKRIKLLPFQNQLNMPVIYRIADVFVLTSVTETWGLSVNEAMACGRTVLISDTCGCALDLVKEGVTGYTFNSGNEIDLINKLLLLSRKKETLSEMGSAAQSLIMDWNFVRVATPIENILNSGI